MSITISWWHIPACITVTWLVVLFWPQRSAWDTIAHGFVVVVAVSYTHLTLPTKA